MISLDAGVVVSSASMVAHISSRGRKPTEHPLRLLAIVGSSS
jgi:hypothetical protein